MQLLEHYLNELIGETFHYIVCVVYSKLSGDSEIGKSFTDTVQEHQRETTVVICLGKAVVQCYGLIVIGYCRTVIACRCLKIGAVVISVCKTGRFPSYFFEDY